MKLLFDQNLSFKLCALLSDLFPDSKPIRELYITDSTGAVTDAGSAESMARLTKVQSNPLAHELSDDISKLGILEAL